MKKIKVKVINKIEKLNPEFAKELKWYNVCIKGEKLARETKQTFKIPNITWERVINDKITYNSYD